MNNLTKVLTVKYISQKTSPTFACLALSSLLFGCASTPAQPIKRIYEDPFSSVTDTTKPKSIFVFMDGTGNNQKVPTNICRIFQEIKGNNDKQTVGNYIEGVGNADTPFLGTTLDLGMEDRIVRGYAFITQQYQHLSVWF